MLPLEADAANYDDHENIRLDVLRAVQAKARAEGLWAPQAPKEYGGHRAADRRLGGDVRGGQPLDLRPARVQLRRARRRQYESARARRHPGAEGQMAAPIVDGKVRSSFAMTEPAPGGGSDPGMIRTRAEKNGDSWVIHGHKWFITGAGIADHFILIARTSDDAAPRAHRLPLSPRPARLAHPAAHPDHGAGGAWRPLRARLRRARSRPTRTC